MLCITPYVVYHPEVVFCVISYVLIDLCIIGHVLRNTHVWFCQHAIFVLELLSQSVSVLVNGMNL